MKMYPESVVSRWQSVNCKLFLSDAFTLEHRECLLIIFGFRTEFFFQNQKPKTWFCPTLP